MAKEPKAKEHSKKSKAKEYTKTCLEDSTEQSESNPGRSLGIKNKEGEAVWKTVPELYDYWRAYIYLSTYLRRYCLPDSSYLLGCNPETSSRVTLASLGTVFQTDHLTTQSSNNKTTKQPNN